MSAPSTSFGQSRTRWFHLGVLILLAVAANSQPEYSYDSYQVSDQHRYQEGAMGGFWGHHLGHMVRTASYGLWFVDDTGLDVNRNPAIAYYRFEANRWVLVRTLANPLTIQQNTATIAVGDSIYTYGLNINGGYIEEAVCDPRTGNAAYNRRIRYVGPSTNYIGAAVSPGGTRVVWWTRVVNANGPSDWVYMYNPGSGWSNSIVSQIPGNDYSYCFASFLNDTTFHIGGEIPGGDAPNWTFSAAAGTVVLGAPLADFTVISGDNTAANDIWVNRTNGDAHLFLYGSYGGIGYFYKPAGGVWTSTVTIPDVGNVSRCRVIDASDGNLYLVLSQSGFKMMAIPKAEITGKIDFTGRPLINLGSMEGFTASYAIWPESPQFQTTPVGGINFVYPGNDYSNSRWTRHISVARNPGIVDLRVSMPNGLEVLEGNKNRWIYWYRRTSAGIDSVRIDFSSDGGGHWSVSVPSIRNTGSFLWKVPPVESADCRIRVQATSGSGSADTSDASFLINYTPVILKAPLGWILNPTKDTTLTAGSMISFEGAASDTDGYIVNYVWKTGDGRTVKGIARKFAHAYATPGTYEATLQVQDNDTLWSVPDTIRVVVQGSSDVQESGVIPEEIELLPSYPNPFNAETIISYSLDRAMFVRLRIFSIAGAEMARLVDQPQRAGTYHVSWDARTITGRALASGWYVCRLETPVGSRVQKVLLIR